MVETLTIFLLSSLFLFLIGIMGGWLVAERSNNVRLKTRLQVIVGVLVTIVWVISIAAEILIPAYTVSTLIHGIMGAVVGYLFTEEGITIGLGSNNATISKDSSDENNE
jgi:hypothetical protein